MTSFKSVLAACGILLLIGCSQKPEESDVRQILASQLPLELNSALQIDQLQTEASASGDDILIKFKARVTSRESLYAPIDLAQAAQSAGADLEPMRRVEMALKELTSSSREQLAKDIVLATERPTFLRVATPAQSGTDWYGSFKARKVVDKWIPSQFQGDSALKFDGLPAFAFPTDAVQPSSSGQWFNEKKRIQLALLDRLQDAKRMEQQDAAVAAAQAAESQARATAENERLQKQQLVTAIERQVRQMPIAVGFRPAAFGKGKVLILEARQAMTVRLEVRRGMQSFTKDLQIYPGRRAEVGHLKGWAFASEDQMQISNPNFDPARFVVQ